MGTRLVGYVQARMWDRVVMLAVICSATVSCVGACVRSKGGSHLSGPQMWGFEGASAGVLPKGWDIAASNPTAVTATWQVLTDRTAPSPSNVFALTESKNYDGTYNLAMANDTRYEDLELTVRVKAVGGTEDQGGGPIWRCQDRNNYYIARLNPLEGNFRVYVVHKGKRRQLDHAAVALSADRWYEIKVRMVGRRIECSLDGQSLLQATDDTITRAGKIGLWTKADAVTSFDDLVVQALPASPPS